MKKAALTLMITAVVVCSCDSCGISSRSNSDYYTTEGGSISDCYEDEDYELDDDDVEEGGFQLTGRIETCNKCMGYGMVQDGLYGQPEICKFCWISTNMRVEQGWTGFDGRFGQVDAVFNTLPANYFDNLSWNEGEDNEDNASASNSHQIEAEIAWHEENIAKIEHQLEYIEGGVNRIYLEQQLIEERNEVKRLRRLLEN